MGVKLNLLWRSQEVIYARNVESLPRKATINKQNPLKKETAWAANCNDVGVQLPNLFWSSHLAILCPRCQTMSYRV
jgi:hypothetical protein